jgi:superfamily II DNA/RNA helicase
MGFKSLNLDEKIINELEKAGLTTPTAIQERAIPMILEGSDLRASAQTGTGKTAAFVLPALHRLAKPCRPGRGPRVLILAPTRELAMQVGNVAAKYGSGLPHLKTVCIFGGVPYPMQNRQLSRPYDILVATPGRLIDHLERGRIDLSRVELFVLDEADRMLDMGFIEPVEHIAEQLPKGRQTLLFSATLSKEVRKLSEKLLKNPLEVAISPEKAKHDQITQHFEAVENIGHKHRRLDEILKLPELNQAIIFTATQRSADELADKLSVDGHDASALHGGMNQRQRTRTITSFKQNRLRILVATDVAARGIDVLTISHVVNFDLPMSGEDYVHRIGRTGRAGGLGTAISFAARRDSQKLIQIEKYTGQAIGLFKESHKKESHKGGPHPTKPRFPKRGGFQARGFKKRY